MSNLLDLIARIFISLIFLFSGINKIITYDATFQWMEQAGMSGYFLIPAIALEIIAAVLIIIGYQAKLAATLLALFCFATAFLFHFDFSNQMQIIAFLKNIGLAGGLLFLIVNGPKEFVLFKKKKYVRL